MNISGILENSTRFFPDRPAICENGIETSYSRLNDQANCVASGLVKMGIKPGDAIALCAPNPSNGLRIILVQSKPVRLWSPCPIC
jgi:long-chain acyl-CoA synthetase